MTNISRRSPQQKAAWVIERDLCTMTGPELTAKYGSNHPAAFEAFHGIVGQPVADIARTHNPLFHYAMAVWFDNPEGRALIYPPRHRDEMAAALLAVALGELDSYDGTHCCWPRRSLKSTWLMAFSDWVFKREKLVNGRDVTVFYVHNSEDAAAERSETIKQKNREHDYIARYFQEFRIPVGEWGTKTDWSWPCRRTAQSVVEPSLRAMSLKAKKAGKGANYLVCDDMEDEDSWESAKVRKDVKRQYLQIRKLKAVPFTREISAGTPYHPQSLYKPMREEKHADGTPRYFCLVKPALTEDDRPNFPSIPSLTVEGLAKERANEIAQTGSDFFWYLQYQLEPSLTGTQAMQWDWWLKLPVVTYRQNWKKLPHLCCVFIDSAWKGETNQLEGDYTAIGVIDIYQMGEHQDRILTDLVVSNELTSDEGAMEVARLMKRHDTPYFSVEQISDKTFSGLMRQVARSQRPPIHPIELDLKGWSKKNKEHRISVLAGAARLGHVYYLEGIEPRCLRMLELQATEYPGSLHRDILDMMANSFAESVSSRWVPVSVATRPEYAPDMESELAYATPYTRIPVFG